jgi:hypothetical protein
MEPRRAAETACVGRCCSETLRRKSARSKYVHSASKLSEIDSAAITSRVQNIGADHAADSYRIAPLGAAGAALK